MRPRKKSEEIPIPEGDSFWSVDLGSPEEPNLQHFEMPRYTIACAVLGLGERYTISKPESHQARGIRAQYHAAIIGVCWHNRVALLETPPLAGPVEDFGEYGEKVIEELRRYDLDQITLMGEACDEEVRKRLGYVGRAAERAKTFTAAEAEAAEPPAEAAEQSSPEK